MELLMKKITLTILALSILLAACGKRYKLNREELTIKPDWPYARYDLQNTGNIESTSFDGSLDVIWEYQSNDKPTGPLTIYNNKLIYPGARNKIKFLDKITGEYKGYIKPRGAASSGLMISDSLGLYTTLPPKSKVKCVNLLNRKTVWEKPVKEAVCGSIIIDKTAVTAFSGGTVAAFTLADGELLWQVDLKLHLTLPPLAVGDTIIQPTDNGEIILLAKTDGTKLNSFNVANEITGLPVYDRFLYVSDITGKIYQLDLSDGQVDWSVEIGGPIWGAMTVTDEHIFAAHSGGEMVALNRNDGSTAWKFDVTSVIRTAPLAVGQFVCFGTMTGEVYCLNISDGSVVEQRTLKGPLAISPITDGTYLYVADDKGLITCFGARHDQTEQKVDRTTAQYQPQ